jgi:gas vesicle protein
MDSEEEYPMASNDFTSAHVLLAFLSGAAVGAGVAFLTAPHSGADTRQWITDSMANKRDEISKLPPALRAAYDAATEAAKGAYKENLAANLAAVAAVAAEEE